MRHFVRIVRAVFLVPLVALLTAMGGGGGPIAGFRTTSDVTMRIYVPTGRVVIRTWLKDSVDVRGTIARNAQFFGGGSRTHVKLGVEARSSSDSTLPGATFEVVVPRNARVWVKVIDGEVDVRGTDGELEAYAMRGRITVRETRGTTLIESIDAPVTVANVSGDLRVRGSKGAVMCDSVQGTASVATVSGPVTLRNFVADARVETIGGDVTLFGRVGRATVDVQTHAGAIALTFDAKAVPQLDLSTRAGAVEGAKLSGTIANGRVTARSFKGRIVVAATPPPKLCAVERC